MKGRRNFFKNLAVISGGAFLPSLINSDIEKTLISLNEDFPDMASSLKGNEDFWMQIRQMYSVSPNIINLNNGGVSPQPKVVQEAVERFNQLSNETPSYYMWRTLDKGRQPLRKNLADLAGCSPNEIAINRNSSEALETVIFGLQLKRGDEVILSKQDYPNMMNAWKQRELRDGIVLRWIDFQFPIEDDEKIVSEFTSLFTNRTKIVHVTHMINWMGQIMPVQKIARKAHASGIEVLVDGAHSFAQFEFNIPDLECDYFGTSLHKWLCAPFGSGLLYVKEDKIANLYPLFAAPDAMSNDIRKFEHLGTRSFAIEMAIGQAVLFHQMIGIKRKQERLHYLKNYWAKGLESIDGFSIGTSLDPKYGCAIGLLKHDVAKPAKIAQYLFSKYGIHAVAINYNGIEGVRVTPNVYTLTSELDRFLEALSHFKNP